jgi:hypothetical protein
VDSLEVEPVQIGGKPVDICLMMRNLRWEINMTILPFNPYLSLQKNALGFQTQVLAFTPRSPAPLINPLFTERWRVCVKGFEIPEELDNGHVPRIYNADDGTRIPLQVFNANLKLHVRCSLCRRSRFF